MAVTEAIHTAIVNSHYELLRRADDLHERFTALMLQGGGIPGVLSLLADAIANPVFLEDADGRLLYYAAPTASTGGEDPVAVWSHAAAQAESLGVTAAVPAGDDLPAGRLLALPVETAFDPFASLALERAAGIVALAFLRARQEDELLALGRGDLLIGLAAGRIGPGLAESRAREMGFAGGRSDSLLPLVARLIPDGGRAAGNPHAGIGIGRSWTPVLRELEQQVTAPGAPTLLGVDPSNGDLLLVHGLRNGGERTALAARAAAVVRDVARRQSDADVVVAAGPAADWAGVGAGLREAAESVAVASRLPARAWHDSTTMPLDRLLWRLRHDDALLRYVELVLGPVLAHDARRRHALLPTLEAFCEHGGRKAQTARALHLNRQALYDRISRLEQVLGGDLSDARRLLALHLAIRARHIWGGTGERVE